MSNKPIKPISSIFLDPLIKYGLTSGISEKTLILNSWDGKSKWIEADDWVLVAERLESLSKNPLACYHAGFLWVEDILENIDYYTDSRLVVGRTYTLEKEYLGGGCMRITMHHAPNMEPPRSGVLFNLGGLNAIARNNNPGGKAILKESQCEDLQPLPSWHPETPLGVADVFELT